MQVIATVLLLLLAVVVSGLLARITRLPGPLVQIVCGSLLAYGTPITVALEPDVFFLLFLPPLLFLDGWRIPKDELFRDASTVAQLALGLVVFTVVGVGYFIHWLLPQMPLAVAFALAAIISPTDPVAVSAIATRVPIPRRMMHILEGEALLNDASGLVCMRFAVAAALTGVFSLPAAVQTFVLVALGSLATGVAGTWLLMKARALIAGRFGGDSGAEILVSLLLPFGVYLLAELVHASGILAAAAAGITMGFMQSARVSAVTRIRSTVVWDMIQFAANGVIFVLLGEQLPAIARAAAASVRHTGDVSVVSLGIDVAVIVCALAALRFAWVWTSLRVTRFRSRVHGRASPAPEARLLVAMSLGGVRGAVTLAGILTLPLTLTDGTPFPARDLAIFVAAGVIVVSIVVASVALPRVLHGLELPEAAGADEEDRARVAAAEAAIRGVAAVAQARASNGRDEALLAQIAAQIIDVYQRRIARQSQHAGGDDEGKASADAERRLWLAALRAERDAVYALGQSHAIGEQTMRKLVREIDLQEARFAGA